MADRLSSSKSRNSSTKDVDKQDAPAAREGSRRSAPAGSKPDTQELARQQRAIQQGQQARDAQEQTASKAKPKAKAMQAGKVREPEGPLPAQRLDKPGNEHEMQVKPRYLAEAYKGSGKLEGLSAVITGGDSGIGRAVAVLFAREGADVTIVYLNEHQDAEETQRAVEAEGRRCVLMPGDVRNPAFCKRAVQKAVKTFGKLDILVNNAAFQSHAASIEDISEEQLTLTLDTNIHGYFHMVQAALPHLKEGSSIINTGSVTGLEGSAHLLDYSATKGAIHAFTKSLASNLVERGIRVNAVAPGPVWTPLNPADQKPEAIQEFGSKTDIKRPAQPEELSPAYVFLAAPACASYITGIVLPVTGSVGAI
jgi:NAD(P)-dependent dehydrogenase (short-subunit alcohol dehydrogenase family)